MRLLNKTYNYGDEPNDRLLVIKEKGRHEWWKHKGVYVILALFLAIIAMCFYINWAAISFLILLPVALPIASCLDYTKCVYSHKRETRRIDAQDAKQIESAVYDWEENAINHPRFLDLLTAMDIKNDSKTTFENYRRAKDAIESILQEISDDTEVKRSEEVRAANEAREVEKEIVNVTYDMELLRLGK